MKDISYPSTYAQADALLQGRNKQGRKLGNNTYLKRLSVLDQDSIAVRYHSTDIVTFHPDGRIVLNSGGWRTMTTKARINACDLPYTLAQDKGIWYIGQFPYWENKATARIFADGVTILPDGKLTGAQSLESVKPVLKLKKQAQQYVRDYVRELLAGHVSKPSGADCWYCALETTDGQNLGEVAHSDHIKAHIKEKYYVPSLIQQAVKRFPVSIAASEMLQVLLNGNTSQDHEWMRGITARQVSSSLKRYVYTQLQIAS